MKFQTEYVILMDKEFPYYLKNSTLTYAVKLEISSSGRGINVFYFHITKNTNPTYSGRNEFGYALEATEWAASLCSDTLLEPTDSTFWSHMIDTHIELSLKLKKQ